MTLTVRSARSFVATHRTLLLAAIVPLLLFCVVPPLSRAGLWDPYEITVADRARAASLGESAGSLPVACVALGFRLFGAHDWAGRLPLAMIGVLGALATYAWVARLVDRRAGLYAAIALSTMPLFLVAARTLLGDVVTMSASSAAFGGLAVLTLAPPRGLSRAPWIAMALAGLLAGLAARGAILGVAVPCLAVAAAYAVDRASAPRAASRDAAALLLVLIGGVALAIGWRALLSAAPGATSALAGVTVQPPAHAPSWDRTLAHLGHALFPWSAFVPFALGRLFVAPPIANDREDAADRESRARVLLVIGSATALVAHAMLATRAELVPFSAPALLAAACAVALRDFERGATPSATVAAGTLLLAAVLQHDLATLPEKAYEAFGVGASAFPAALKAHASRAWGLAAVALTAGVVLAWAESDGDRRPFDRARYERWARSARAASGGALVTAAASLVAGLALLALLVYLGMRTHAHVVATLPAQVRVAALNAWWVVPLVPTALVLVWNVALDGIAWSARRLARFRVRRAALVLVSAGAAALVLCVGYYPALADELSPKGVFAAYQRAHAPGDPIALLGLGDRGAAYYVGGSTVTLRDGPAAVEWLGASEHGRRFVAAAATELPRLNALHRARAHVNVPVVDATDHAVLAVSARRPDEASRNPLDSIVLDAAPKPRHPLAVDLDGRLQVLGFDLVDGSGKPVEAIAPGRRVHVRTYYRVLAPIGSEYTVFVHLDGLGRRHNADHPPASQKYPMTLWQAGDIIVDDYELSLEPNFTPGSYRLYFGLYPGGGSGPRMRVKSGPSDGDDRILGGVLRVE